MFINTEAKLAYDKLQEAIEAAPVSIPCQQTYPDAWFEEIPEKTIAKQLCGKCPVKLECLEFALRNEEAHGIWGGTTMRQRRDLRRMQKRG
jgi:WhiB family redox-sensing transcriptional regulator